MRPTDPAPPTSPHRRYRHPSDLARLVVNLVLLGILIAIAVVAPGGVKSVAENVAQLVLLLPLALVEGAVGVTQLLAIVLPVAVLIVLAWRRRFDLLAILVLAVVISSIAMALLSNVAQKTVPVSELGYERVESWLIGSQFPSSPYLAAATAVLVAGGPWMSRRWRRASWGLLAVAVVARLVTATEVPVRVGMLLTLGAASGSLALVLFGAPRRRIDPATVQQTLATVGVATDDLQPRAEEGGTPTFTGTDAGGSALFVKVIGRDERDTDLLLTTWRSLTLRGLDDDASRRSPERVVEREALAMGMLRTIGVRTALPVAIAATSEGAGVLAATRLDGPRLVDLADGELTDEALDELWAQVALMQTRRIAHRRLNATNVRLTDEGPALIDLRWTTLDGSDETLGVDVAELVASLATVVGPDRSIAAAGRNLSHEQLARAVPLMQHAVLTSSTRRALGDKKAVTALRDAMAEAAGIEKVQLTPVSRISLKEIVSTVGSIVLLYYVISLAANWDDIWDSFSGANLAYSIPILALALAPYVTGAMSLMGAVTTHLAFLRTTAVMFAQSFLNRFTPANAGGMAMRMRYLQLNGQETAVAAASIGLTSMASGVMQVLLIVVFLIWGGASDRLSDFSFPSVGTILVVIIAIGLVVTLLLFSAWGRKVVRPRLRDTVAKLRTNMGELLRDPVKMLMLFGGALLGKLATILAFWLSVHAFGVDMSLPKAGALYMIANSIGSAVPTPGGVGGIEAALTGVLISFGVDNATAAAIVLFFRIQTFWLPTAPGYGFMQYCKRVGIV